MRVYWSGGGEDGERVELDRERGGQQLHDN